MLGRYLRFLAVGVFVTLATVAFRALLGWLLQDDSLWVYAATILLAYAFGVTLGFFLHHKVTFSMEGSASGGQFARFIGVHLVGMSCTTLGSWALREATDRMMPLEVSKTVAFATAAFLVSALSFLLNSRFVFRADKAATEEADRSAPSG